MTMDKNQELQGINSEVGMGNRERDLERANMLWEKAKPNAEVDNFDELTIAALKETMELFEKWDVKEKTAKVYTYWAKHQNFSGNYETGVAYAQKQLMLSLELYEEESIEVAESYYDLCWQHWRFQYMDIAEKYLNQSFNKALKVSNGNNTVVAHCYIMFASLQFFKHNYLSSLHIDQKALSFIQKLSIKPDSLLILIYNNLACDYFCLDDYELAGEYFQLTLKIISKSKQPNKNSLVTIYNNLGGVYSRIGDDQKAYYYCQKSLTISEENILKKIDIYYILSSAIYRLKGCSEAITCCQTAINILNEKNIYKHTIIPPLYYRLSEYHYSQEDTDKALFFLQKALESAILCYGNGDVEEGRIYRQFGHHYINMKQFAKAKSYLQKSLANFQAFKNTGATTFSNLWTEWGALILFTKRLLTIYSILS